MGDYIHRRNLAIDTARFLASFLVIVIHAPVPGAIGSGLEVLSRAAVPFFFMVSGYFSYNCSENVYRKRVKRQLSVLTGAVLLYIGWTLLFSLRTHTTVQVLKSYISVKGMLEALVLQQGTLLGHLWFLLVLSYCYFACLVLKQKLTPSVSWKAGGILLVLHFLMKVVLKQYGIGDVSYFTRNFLLTGLPMFLIGYAISAYAESMVLLRDKRCILAMILLGSGAAFLEKYLFGMADLYFGSIFLATGVLLLCIGDRWHSAWMSDIGRKDSEMIYIFHVAILAVINMGASFLGILQLPAFLYLRPIIVCVCSILLSRVLKLLLSMRKEKL